MSNILPQFVARKGSILSALPEPCSPGEKKRIGRMIIWIGEELGSATTRRVYRVMDASGTSYAYKIASDPKVIRNEEERTNELAGKLPVARILLSGKKWVLREWIDGLQGRAWLEHGEPDQARLDDLRTLVEAACAEGFMVSQLEPENLVWREGTWFIIDCGKVRRGMPEEAMKKYRKKLAKSWGITL